MGLSKKDFFIRRAQKMHGKSVARKKKNTKRREYNRQLRKKDSYYIPQKFSRKEVTISLPDNFTLADDLQAVIRFIAQLKFYTKVQHEVYRILLNLENVIRIDIGAITLLLSSIKELAINNIKVEGNLPKEKICEDYIIASGFLDHMNILSSDLRKKVSNVENSIIMNGHDKTDHRRIGSAIKTAMKKLCGYERHYKPLYGVIGEMTINALEHAYRKNKHWIFAINFEEKKDKLIFSFIDNGYGIYTRLTRTFGLKVFEVLGLKTDADIVEGMFDENYNSRFKKQYNRNSGLPAIRALQDEKKVANLILITNNIFINFATGEKIELNSNFSGTFYYWELEKKILKNETNSYKGF